MLLKKFIMFPSTRAGISSIYYEEEEERSGEYEEREIESTPKLNLKNLEFDVKSTDMSENTVKFIVEKTILAF